MNFRVLNVAYPFAPVGPDAVGGAEQVLTQIDAALVLAGHESFVVACQGSKPLGRYCGGTELPRNIDEETRIAVYRVYRQEIQKAIGEFDIDLIHFHGIDFYNYLPQTELPILVTLHLPLPWYSQSIHSLPKNVWLHCVSEAQQRGMQDLQLLEPIPNGVFVPGRICHAKRKFALALGRICPEKGFHLAFEAAKRANFRCYLAGEVFPYANHVQYFETEIRAQQDAMRRFIGPVGGSRKRRLLSGARCVLIPSLVAETSSLVAMEAMAHGTPVISFPSGALPTIVEDGVTGFIVHSVEEMADAILRVGELSSENCLRAARERFALERMTDQYLERYEQLIGTGCDVNATHGELAFA